MARPAPAAGPEVLAGPGPVTAISGLTFVISDELGDIGPGPFGLMARDTRHLSLMQVRVNGERLQHLGAGVLRPETAQFRGYALLPGAYPDAPVESRRVRQVGPDGVDEELWLQCWAPGEIEVRVVVALAADFADIFEVRRLAGAARPAASRIEVGDGRREIRFVSEDGRRRTRVHLSPPPDDIESGHCAWTARLSRDDPWRLALAIDASSSSTRSTTSPMARSRLEGRADAEVTTDPERLAAGCRRSLADLDRLSMPDTLDPSRRLLAAGIPWFVALFGRDALISSYQARAFRPRLMLDTLGALAARQGRVDDPGNEEQPGKILHEVRLTDRPWLGEGTTGGHRPYYGSVDATPLFLVLFGEALRWGAPRAELQALLPAALAAAEWMRGPGDPDGDGLIEYGPGAGRTLANQGWKDSENAVQFPDRRPGPAGRSRWSRCRATPTGAGASWPPCCAGWATTPRPCGWRPRRRPCARSCASGSGAPPRRACPASTRWPWTARSAGWTRSPPTWDTCSGAACPTTTRPGRSPGTWSARAWRAAGACAPSRPRWPATTPSPTTSGSVWPHDTAIACEGLRRYGLDRAAMRLVGDLLDALALFEDRLPELFGGHPRAESEFPVPYPTACRPQAWAAGVPLSFVPLLLGLEPHVPAGTVSLQPGAPADRELAGGARHPAARRPPVRRLRRTGQPHHRGPPVAPRGADPLRPGRGPPALIRVGRAGSSRGWPASPSRPSRW